MQRFLVVVECAIEMNNKFLLIKRPGKAYAGDLLSFPGGKVEYSDGSKHQAILINAVKREVREEVGVDLTDPLHYVTSSHFIGYQSINVLNNVFYCKVESSNIEIQASEREVADYYWLTMQETLNQRNTPEWLKYYLQCIERKKTSKSFY